MSLIHDNFCPPFFRAPMAEAQIILNQNFRTKRSTKSWTTQPGGINLHVCHVTFLTAAWASMICRGLRERFAYDGTGGEGSSPHDHGWARACPATRVTVLSLRPRRQSPSATATRPLSGTATGLGGGPCARHTLYYSTTPPGRTERSGPRCREIDGSLICGTTMWKASFSRSPY